MVTTTTTIGTGIMNRQQADRFYRIAQDQTTLLKRARTHMVDHPKGQIDKIQVGNRLLRAVGEGATVAETDPTWSKLDYDSVKAMLRYSLTREAVEDSIEKGQIVNTVTTMFAHMFGYDLEDLGINGDGSTGDFLSIDRGWLDIISADDTQVPAANKYNHSSASIDKSLFSEMIKKLPNKYRAMPGLMWMLSPNQLENFKDYLSDRATVGGDHWLMSQPNEMITIRGLPVITPASWPDDQVVLTKPENLVNVVQRNINVRSTQVSDEVVDNDLFAKWNLTARFDYIIEDGLMVSYGYGVA